jgi:uncharacterized repeat protein (TIGR01451 family)
MKKVFTLLFSLVATTVFALDPGHFTITRISAPYFIVDGNSPTAITKAYVGFEVTNNSNSGVTYTALKFTIASIGTSVAGQNYTIVSPVSGITNVGTLAPGQSKVCYYYISYPANVTPQATFNLQLSDNTASSKTQSIVIRNRSSISANAGGTATQTVSNQDIIGGIIEDDVTYVVGNVQSGDENDFQVAVSAQFDPTKITLLGTQVIASSVPGIGIGTTDSLYFISGNGSNGATITIRWKFRISGFNLTTYLLPCAGATSGSTNYKYALNTSLGAGTAVTISAAANPLTISKTSNSALYGINSNAVFTITIGNPGAFGVTIDKVTDELPAGFIFQSFDAASQVTAANSANVPVNGATGNIVFEGGIVSGVNTSYYIPAGGSIVIKYNATTSSTSASNLTTFARDYVAATEVGVSQNIVSVSATLPVTLTSFKGDLYNNMARLQWTTTNEFNSGRFEIERSCANSNFTKIGTVAATGFSGSAVSYSFIDSTAFSGVCQYRLKMIDHDLQYKYSAVVSLTNKINGISIEKIYPNPVISETTISLRSDKAQEILLQLTDITGKILIRKNATCRVGLNTWLLDGLGLLQKGSYLLQLITKDQSLNEKLVKIK